MRGEKRWAALALSCVLLAGCAKWDGSQTAAGTSASSPPSGPNVQVDWSVLTEETPLPAVGERWYTDYTPELIPSADYGPLLPFKGAVGMTLAWWEEEPAYTSPSWFYGLMTLDGTLVMDPVCASISRLGYTAAAPATREQITRLLPVYAMSRGDPELGDPSDGELMALAAEDGSWWTGFRFWGAVAYPDGIAAGDKDGLTLLDAQTGAQTDYYTWSQLGISDGASLPWFTGDATSCVQWTGKNLFLGCFGENYDTAVFLKPGTGKVTTCSAEDWYRQWEQRYQQYAAWVPHSNGDGTVTLTLGSQSRTITSPLPQDEYPSVVGGDRVYFSLWNQESTTFAVTDLEGKVLIPVQTGELTILNGSPESELLLFALGQEDGWRILDRDGKELYTLPGGNDSWCYLNGTLIEVVQEDCASYYSAQTGDCVRRTYAGLPG